MTGAKAEPESATSGGVPVRWLLLLLFALFALDNVLVSAFLGKPAIMAATAIAACGFLALLGSSEARSGKDAPVAWRTIICCLLIACVLLLLGGEGRLFFANEDWQVRDAVLADMARQPWPFAYLTGAGERVLRAPLGMYLLPALIGQGGQTATDLALLGCNTLMLGLPLALAATLFPAGRARRIALIVFVAFGGLDIVGTLLINALGGAASYDHLERWAPHLQYSSVVTLIFWVPQHAIAGWFCALLYLLHRRGGISFGSLAASIPIAAIWSPLAVIGAVPLVVWAGLRTLKARALRLSDVATALAALIVSLPALAYLAADAERLPSGFQRLGPLMLALFLLLELMPFLWILYRLNGARRFGIDSLALAVGMLVLIPFFHIGDGADFVMRASIAPLALLIAMLIAGLIDADHAAHRQASAIVALLLSLGAVTGVAEIARALRLAPAPPPQCSLPAVWHRQTGWVADISSYVARPGAMPAFLRPRPQALVDPRDDPPNCWSRSWRRAR